MVLEWGVQLCLKLNFSPFNTFGGPFCVTMDLKWPLVPVFSFGAQIYIYADFVASRCNYKSTAFSVTIRLPHTCIDFIFIYSNWLPAILQQIDATFFAARRTRRKRDNLFFIWRRANDYAVFQRHILVGCDFMVIDLFYQVNRCAFCVQRPLLPLHSITNAYTTAKIIIIIFISLVGSTNMRSSIADH